jgi:hypothetical protein
MNVEPVSPEVVAEIETVGPQVAAVLGVGVDDEPQSIVAAIDQYVDEHRAEEIDVDVVVALGALLGSQYVRAFGWKWAALGHPDDEAVFSVVDQDHTIANQPLHWVRDVAERGRDVNFLLNFNMVAAGDVPPPRGDGPAIFC